MMNIVEIEMDSQDNSNPQFLPLQRSLRGRFAFWRVAEPMAAAKRAEWGDEIPGQRLALNLDTSEGVIIEPLHEEQHRQARARIEQHRFSIPPAIEQFSSVHVPTWLFWIRQLVQAGLARLVKGQIPQDLGGEPRLGFFSSRSVGKPNQGDLAELRQMNQQLMEQNRKLMAMLEAQQQEGRRK